MKIIRNIALCLLSILLGFWLATSNVLSGTAVGDFTNSVMSYLPITRHYYEDQTFDFMSTEDSVIPVEESSVETDVASTSEDSSVLDLDIIQNEIIRLTNDLRASEGLYPLTENGYLHQAGQVRAEETAVSFSHTRPDGREPFTVFDDGIPYNYQLVGENLGMATYFQSELEMAELLFQGWVDSPGHYENMMKPEFEEIGVGVHYDGENIYATQMFGTEL